MLDLLIEFFITGYGAQCQMAIAPLILAALGAGVGVLSNKEKQEEANRQRQYEAETARWSPWTNMTSKYVSNPSFIGDVAGGAASGLSFGAMNPGMFGGGQSSYGAMASGGRGGQGYLSPGMSLNQEENPADLYRLGGRIPR